MTAGFPFEIPAESWVAALPLDRRWELARIYGHRVQSLEDLHRQAAWAKSAPTAYDQKALKKFFIDDTERLTSALVKFLVRGDQISEWDLWAVRELVESTATDATVRLGTFTQVLRIALTGASVGPWIHEIVVYLGKTETLSRVVAFLRREDPLVKETA